MRNEFVLVVEGDLYNCFSDALAKNRSDGSRDLSPPHIPPLTLPLIPPIPGAGASWAAAGGSCAFPQDRYPSAGLERCEAAFG